MVGGIKAISSCVKSASAKLFLDLNTVLATSGEERTLNAAPHRSNALRYLASAAESCAQPGVRWVHCAQLKRRSLNSQGRA